MARDLEKARESYRKWYAANKEKVRKRYAANPEKAKENAKKWYAANPEKAKEKAKKWSAANKEKAREHVRKWSAANKEKVREKNRKWFAANYAANPEKVMEASKKWREANPEKVREIDREAKARICSRVKNDPFYMKDPKYQTTLVHGHAKIGELSAIYKRWTNAACFNRKNGTVYEPWDASHNEDAFLTFLNDVGDESHDGKRLCRIDKSDGFHPENVEWR